MGVLFEKGEFGIRCVLAQPWSEPLRRQLHAKRIAELELNDGKGWLGTDVSFLTEFPELRALSILRLPLKSVKSINALHELRRLTVFTYCNTEIRFENFPHLVGCSLEWRPKAISLFDCKTLTYLFINHYQGKGTEQFARLENLESLAILNAPIRDLRGLANLRKLRSLRLAGLSRLGSLSGIQGLTNLEELNIHTCNALRSVTEIESLEALKRLHLNNCGAIESLSPLRSLRNLEFLSFYESTNIVDGDLSPLTENRKLTSVTFQNRRHYSHSLEGPTRRLKEKHGRIQ
jgi:Leucine-rich repeat (LRR) protein